MSDATTMQIKLVDIKDPEYIVDGAEGKQYKLDPFEVIEKVQTAILQAEGAKEAAPESPLGRLYRILQGAIPIPGASRNTLFELWLRIREFGEGLDIAKKLLGQDTPSSSNADSGPMTSPGSTTSNA
jgi:hypothetical protein